MSKKKSSETIKKDQEQSVGELPVGDGILSETQGEYENDAEKLEELDLEEELGLEEGFGLKRTPEQKDREEVSLWNTLTYGVVIVLVVLLCTLVWVATHRKQDGDVVADAENTENMMEAGAGDLPTQDISPENGSYESISHENISQENASSDSLRDNMGSNPEALGQNSGQENQGGTASPGDPEPVSGDSSMTFREVNETVTAKDVTNLRSEPNTADAGNVLAQLINGDTLTRTGINEDTGWSRLLRNDQEVYAVTQYLTTDLSYRPPVAQGDPNRVTTIDGRVIIFVDCDDTITPKEYVNLRSEPSTSQGDSTVRAQLQYGGQAHRTGYSPDAGWSRVEYNGEVLYVVTSYVFAVQ